MPAADRTMLDTVFRDKPNAHLNWFCEFTSPDDGLGGYFRYGVVPDENIVSVIVQLAGPNQPMVSLVDLAAPINGAPSRVQTGRFGFEHGAPSPGTSYRITVDGTGDMYADPSGPLRGDSPKTVEVSIDLTWTTGGVPFTYPLSPGYEIPCWTSGVVTIDSKRFTIQRAPSQRNHTIGKRDWWAMQWVWAELRLSDASHLIATEVHIPGIGPISMGCLQDPAGQLLELESVLAEVSNSEDGLPQSTRILIEPGPLVVSITTDDIKGRVCLPLIAADGRVAHFIRAWVTPSLPDGRTASGWIEWHRHP